MKESDSTVRDKRKVLELLESKHMQLRAREEQLIHNILEVERKIQQFQLEHVQCEACKAGLKQKADIAASEKRSGEQVGILKRERELIAELVVGRGGLQDELLQVKMQLTGVEKNTEELKAKIAIKTRQIERLSLKVRMTLVSVPVSGVAQRH